MDMAALRHKIVSQNIANVNTPGFRALEVEFRLPDDAEETPQGLDPEAAVIRRAVGGERADGNNVDIDQQIGQLSNSELLYQAYSQILASQMATMQRAISG